MNRNILLHGQIRGHLTDDNHMGHRQILGSSRGSGLLLEPNLGVHQIQTPTYPTARAVPPQITEIPSMPTGEGLFLGGGFRRQKALVDSATIGKGLGQDFASKLRQLQNQPLKKKRQNIRFK